jgi:hypothetical protein
LMGLGSSTSDKEQPRRLQPLALSLLTAQSCSNVRE